MTRHSNLVLDLSFTVLRYAGSSLDQDIRFLCRALDQRVTVGSDFPEYVPSEVIARMEKLGQDMDQEKLKNVMRRNLDAIFGTT